MRARSTRAVWSLLIAGALAAIVVASCVSGDFADGQFRCDPTGGPDVCPEGMGCGSDGLCRRGASLDGGGHGAGGECSSDECGPSPCGPEGCSEGSECTESGCEPICKEATWRWDAPPDVALGGLVRAPDGLLYVGGNQGGSAWVGRFDPCTGFVTSVTFDVPGVSDPKIASLAVQGTDLYAVGSAGVDSAVSAIVAKLDVDRLTVAWATALDPTAGIDVFTSVASVPGGPAWARGVKDVFVQSTPWLTKTKADGVPCDVDVAAFGGIDALEAWETSIYLGVREGAHAAMVRYDELCATSADCACGSNWKSNDLQFGVTSTEVSAITRVGDTLYAVGKAHDDASVQSTLFLVWMDAETSALVGVETWDPTPVDDWISGMATDGDTLFLGGSKGSTMAFDFTNTTATLTAIALPAPSLTYDPDWELDLELDVITGLAADPHPGDGLYLAGHVTGGVSTVARCTKEGDCPVGPTD